jgi:hypothetical protein
MARPTDFPTFATDATFTSGPAVGAAVQDPPPAPALAQGFIPGTGFLSEYWNWFLNKIALNVNYLFQFAYDLTGEHTYETPKARAWVYRATLDDGGPAFGAVPADWSLGLESVNLNEDDIFWMIPLRGIPAQCRIDRIRVRAQTHNDDAGRTVLAGFRVMRYKQPDFLDLGTPLNTLIWEPVLQGLPAPGPWFHEFSADPSTDVMGDVGAPGPTFYIEPGYIYAVMIWSGRDAPSAHLQDFFYGVYVDWTDVGPRNA